MVSLRFRVSPTLRIAAELLLAVLLGVAGYHVLDARIPGSPEALLEQADEKGQKLDRSGTPLPTSRTWIYSET